MDMIQDWLRDGTVTKKVIGRGRPSVLVTFSVAAAFMDRIPGQYIEEYDRAAFKAKLSELAHGDLSSLTFITINSNDYADDYGESASETSGADVGDGLSLVQLAEKGLIGRGYASSAGEGGAAHGDGGNSVKLAGKGAIGRGDAGSYKPSPPIAPRLSLNRHESGQSSAGEGGAGEGASASNDVLTSMGWGGLHLTCDHYFDKGVGLSTPVTVSDVCGKVEITSLNSSFPVFQSAHGKLIRCRDLIMTCGYRSDDACKVFF